MKVPRLTVQVPQGSTLRAAIKSSGSTRFHTKVPFLKVQVPPGSTLRAAIESSGSTRLHIKVPAD